MFTTFLSGSMKNDPLIYILIVNYNQKEDTSKCIKSVQKIDYPNYKIVVIDNASHDNSIEFIKIKYPDITILANKTDSGYAGGMNTGIRYSLSKKADYVLALNNDILVEKSFLSNLVKIAKLDKKNAVIGPKVLHAGSKKIRFIGAKSIFWDIVCRWKSTGKDELDRGQFDNKMEMEMVAGCTCLYDIKIFKRIGLFNENYFQYFEDADLFIRIKKEGFKIIYAPKSVVWHTGSPSPTQDKSDLYYYSFRNKIIFVFKHYGFFHKIIFVSILLFYQVPRFAGAYLLKAGNTRYPEKCLRGVIDGFKYIPKLDNF